MPIAPPDLLSARILVVDDQPANVTLLERVLALEGYRNVESFTDPREVGAAYAARRHDLILLDLNMPHLDGFQLMAQLKTLEPDGYVPILVLTAQADRATRLKALSMGARDFLTKPFDRLEVVNRIRNMLEIRLLHNQIRDQNRLLEERVRERTRELSDTRLEIIRRLGRAAEYRDNETGLHIIRMSKYSALLAQAAGVSADEAEMLLNASPMHDIGKIGIPDRILLKPGKFEPDEWDVMKTHTTIGAELLAGHDSPLMQMASVIALTHHERWDGSGYPRGLAGEAIPLMGRIVAVCDVFDALTSERPYKHAWSIAEARAHLAENAGRHFDPALVKRFDEIFPEILRIREQYPEPGA